MGGEGKGGKEKRKGEERRGEVLQYVLCVYVHTYARNTGVGKSYTSPSSLSYTNYSTAPAHRAQ